jgi:hypothetical protein
MFELMFTDGNRLYEEKYENADDAVARAKILYGKGYSAKVDDLDAPANTPPLFWKWY